MCFLVHQLVYELIELLDGVALIVIAVGGCLKHVMWLGYLFTHLWYTMYVEISAGIGLHVGIKFHVESCSGQSQILE